MSRLQFLSFSDYEDGKMAEMFTVEEMIPVNIYIDNFEKVHNVRRGEYCDIDICAVCSWVKIYPSEEEYYASDSYMAIPAMIPVGAFSIKPDDENFEESPHILFTGKVMDIAWNPDAKEDDVNCCILIETLELVIKLYLRYDQPVRKGFIIHGVAWLYGDLKPDDSCEEG